MSIKAMSHVWEHSNQKGSRLLMLLAIADFADDHGVAYPGIERLAKKTRMSERNAQMTLRALEQAGELTIQAGKGIETGHGCTNRYNLKQYQGSIGYQREAVNFTSYDYGVKPTSPKPSVEPSVEPSEKKSDPAPIVADTPPTPEPTIIEENTPALIEGSGKILAFTSQTETDEDTPRRKPRKSAPVHDALIAAFGLSNQKMTRSADSVYWKAATELQDFPVDRVDELYRYVKRKASAEQWRGFTVNALAKYAPEFLRDNPYKIEYIVDDSALPKAAGAEGDAIPISADKKVEAERLMSELLAKMNGNGVRRGSTNGR